MSEVSVAVPVHNGAAYLAECLECLRTQTFEDIEVVVLDNASDDATAEIAADFAARDDRFRLVSHPRNIGPLPNFLRGLELARSPFFLWRADDDLSDANYIESLRAALLREPDAALAVGSVRSVNMDGSNERLFRFPKGAGAAALMFGARASWFYGLWRRDALAARYAEVTARFPYPWSHDHLTLLPFLIRGAIAETEETTFVQRFKKRAGSAPRTGPSGREMLEVRRAFARECRRTISKAEGLSAWERLRLRALLPAYVEKRSYRLTRIAGALLG